MSHREETKRRTPLRSVEIEGRRQRWVKVLKSLFLVFLIGCLFWLLWAIRGVFVVSTVECQLDGQTCDIAHQQLASRFIGRLIFTHFSLLQTQPASISRKLPHTLIVAFHSPTVLATIEAPDDQHVVALTEFGFIQTATLSAKMPILIDHTIDASAIQSQVDPQTLEFYKSLMQVVPGLPFAGLQSIEVIDTESVRWKFEAGYIIITRRVDFEKQLHTLQYVLQTPTIDITHHTVDLRFEQPVVQ